MKQEPVFIAVAVCNCDDVILGGYTKPGPAIAFAKRVDAKPELRFKSVHQATDTEYLWSRVYRAVGRNLVQIWSSETDPPKKKVAE